MNSNNQVQKFLNRAWKTLILPAIVFAVFSLLLGKDWLNSKLQLTILRQCVQPILICFGMGMLMFMGMMDFSLGAVCYTASIVASYLALQVMGGGIPLLACLTVIISIIMCAITGWLYNLLRIPSLVLSLGIAMIYESLGRLLVPSGCGEIGARDGFLAKSPYCFIILAVGFAIFFVIFNYTTFGHNLRAIGASQAVAAQAGINIKKTKFLAYVVCGLFVGLSAVIFLSSSVKIYAASNMSSFTAIMDAFMGVFIAMFLAQFSGFPVGLCVGVFTMRMLSTGFTTLGMGTTFKSISTGFFLLCVLIFSANQTRPAEARLRKNSAAIANEEYSKSSC